MYKWHEMLNTVIQVVPDFKQFRIINIKINRAKSSSFCEIFLKIKVVFIAETLAIKRESLAGLIFRIQSRSFRTQNTSATLNVIHTCCPQRRWMWYTRAVQKVIDLLTYFWMAHTFLIMFGWKTVVLSFSWTLIFL